MAGARLEKTRWPGIHRSGDRWAYEWTDAHGKRRRGSAATREQASAREAGEEAKAARASSGRQGHARVSPSPRRARLFGADLERDADAKPAQGRYQGRKGAVSTRPATTTAAT